MGKCPLSLGRCVWRWSQESAVVLGSGCIGLCMVMSLRARGMTEIYVSEGNSGGGKRADTFEKIVSHVYDFKDCIEAIEYSLNCKEDVIKSVIKF